MLLNALPAIDEGSEFEVPADEGRQSSDSDIEPAPYPGWLQNAVGGDRRGDAPEGLPSEILGYEDSAHELQCRVADHARVRRGDRLQPCRQGHRFPECHRF